MYCERKGTGFSCWLFDLDDSVRKIMKFHRKRTNGEAEAGRLALHGKSGMVTIWGQAGRAFKRNGFVMPIMTGGSAEALKP